MGLSPATAPETRRAQTRSAPVVLQAGVGMVQGQFALAHTGHAPDQHTAGWHGQQRGEGLELPLPADEVGGGVERSGRLWLARRLGLAPTGKWLW